MRSTLVLVTALLCLSALVATASVSSASSNSQVNQVLTSTVTFGSGVSTSLSGAREIFSGAFTVLSTTGTNLPCEFVAENFTALSGQSVYGNVTSDNPIAVYVVQEASFAHWVSTGTCGNAGDAIASQGITTSYGFNAVIPSSGNWSIVLVNSSNAKNADGYLSAYMASGSSTTTQLLVSTFTSTLPATPSASAAGPQSGIPGFPTVSILLGLIIGLIAAALLRRKRVHTTGRSMG